MYSEESNAKKSMRLIVFLLATTLVIPLAALYFPWRPEAETLGTWFQRSGSIMTILCISIDTKLFSIYVWLNSEDEPSVHVERFKAKYYYRYKAMSILAFLLTIMGTTIWGYGDLIV
ncbi:hypothetical protein F0A17_08635 [Billgrantia pellis]|uniref:Uncharacterized protein n=1 Tax=Billgrantia pellis TaxID=2606936 RepID=A0A7V7G0Y5_9GAMM|nr:hypothetical protein [Halomonas pellis]KAA0012978.1 hypothetical protein F0A17_08635 [Halomonas pellis]